MKKVFVAVLLAMGGMGAFAQKGEKAVGINLNYGTTASNVGLGAKYQHGITDAIRIEPSLTYYFGGSGMLDITVNGHYLFNVAPKINVYPLVGIGFDFCRYEWIDIDWDNYDSYKTTKETDTSFKIDFGGGAEYDVTDKIALGLELRYEVITGGYSQFVVGIGAKYKF